MIGFIAGCVSAALLVYLTDPLEVAIRHHDWRSVARIGGLMLLSFAAGVVVLVVLALLQVSLEAL